MDVLRASILLFDFSCKHPVSCSLGREVFLLHPGRTFAWVSPPGPPPQLFKDSMIHGVEGGTAGTKSMVVRPSSYHGVELYDHLSSRTLLVFLDHSSNLL